MGIQSFLFLTGGAILLGLMGQSFFRLTRVPMPVWLVTAGLALGALNPGMDRSVLFSVAPYFGVVALLLILFEGGSELEITGLFRGFKSAFLLGGLYFLLCWAGTALLAWRFLGFPPTSACLLAFILSGLSPGVVAPFLSEMAADRKRRSFFMTESTLGEILTVLGSLALMAVLKDGFHHHDFSSFSAYFFGSLGIALALSFLAGMVWNRFMGALHREPLAYMFTLAFLFLLYAAVDALGGEGSLSVLCFGFLLGNARWFSHRLSPFANSFFSEGWRRNHGELNHVVRKINSELAFLVRTFFFLFLGLAFDASVLSPRMWGALLAILALYSLARWAAGWILDRVFPLLPGRPHTEAFFLVPRGLANAVVMFVAMGTDIPRSREMLALVLGTILGTNLLTAALARRMGRGSWQARAFLKPDPPTIVIDSPFRTIPESLPRERRLPWKERIGKPHAFAETAENQGLEKENSPLP